MYGPNGYFDANSAIAGANTIDVPNSQSYTLWNRNKANWACFFFERTQPNGTSLQRGANVQAFTRSASLHRLSARRRQRRAAPS